MIPSDVFSVAADTYSLANVRSFLGAFHGGPGVHAKQPQLGFDGFDPVCFSVDFAGALLTQKRPYQGLSLFVSQGFSLRREGRRIAPPVYRCRRSYANVGVTRPVPETTEIELGYRSDAHAEWPYKRSRTVPSADSVSRKTSARRPDSQRIWSGE